MDRERFDALARLLGTTGSRRGAVSALLGVALLGQTPDALAGRVRGHGKGKSKSRGRGHDSRQHRARAGRDHDSLKDSSGGDGGSGDSAQGKSDGANGGGGNGRHRARAAADSRDAGARPNDKGKGPGKRRGRDKGNGADRQLQANAKPAPASCFDGTRCNPGPGANLQNCDFTNSSALENFDCTGCNLQGASLRGADASGANLSNANLSRACLVSADFRGATIDRGTNLHGAIICRTIMPDGSVNNSGCSASTRCCPTCIAIGDTCGGGIGGACCGGASCQNGRCACSADRPNNCNGVCQQCCNDGNCSGSTPKCCDGDCRQCCASGDCPAQVCRTADCAAQGTCKYTPVRDNQSGPLCPAPQVCCSGGCCGTGQICDTRGNGAVCCTPEPPAATCHPPGGTPRCGTVKNNCGILVDCGPCDDITCNTGTCNDRSQKCEYTPVRDLTACDAEAAANGICCGGACVTGNCCANATCTGNSNACTGNTCRCGSGAACTFPNGTCCGKSPAGTCVDTSNDANNCGGCGQRCARNNVCTGDPPRCCNPPGIFCSYLFGLQRRCCSGNCKPFPFAPIGIGTCH